MRGRCAAFHYMVEVHVPGRWAVLSGYLQDRGRMSHDEDLMSEVWHQEPTILRCSALHRRDGPPCRAISSKALSDRRANFGTRMHRRNFDLRIRVTPSFRLRRILPKKHNHVKIT